MSLAYAVGLLASCGVFFAVVMGCFDERCLSLAYAVGLLVSGGVFFAVVMGCFDERCLSLAYAVGLLGEWWVVLYCIGKVL